ncbi:MAG: hypothetical protein FJX76_22650 [Armatimonadetes bacterium]|nr:hypothetical protein [Armatimonadota bacterium]
MRIAPGGAPQNHVGLQPRWQAAACPLPPLDRYASAPLPPAEEEKLQALLAECRAATSRPYYDAEADARARAAYYGDLVEQAAQLPPNELARRLTTLLTRTHTTRLEYDPSRHLYPTVDRHPDGKLHSIYSGRTMAVEDVIRHDFALQCATSMDAATVGLFASWSDLGAVFNCEHVVPQGWFDRREPMRGDLHHLFTCDPVCNGLRGNLPYFEDVVPGEKVPDCGTVSPDQTRFEPGHGRGAVARATLYFLLRYPGQVDEIDQRCLDTLLKWHREEPPGLYERHRNVEIALRQGNRNPLIDFPEWADRVVYQLRRK